MREALSNALVHEVPPPQGPTVCAKPRKEIGKELLLGEVPWSPVHDNSSELQETKHNFGSLDLGCSAVSKGKKQGSSSSRFLWGLRLVLGRF